MTGGPSGLSLRLGPSVFRVACRHAPDTCSSTSSTASDQPTPVAVRHPQQPRDPIASVPPLLTVNLMPSGDPDDLAGLPIYVGTTRYTIREINEWQWLLLTSPSGVELVTCVDIAEHSNEIDGLSACANALSRSKSIGNVWGPYADRYLLRGKFVWLHYEYGGPAICTWLVSTPEDMEVGVQAARSVDQWLLGGSDKETTATMVTLETQMGVFFA